MKVKKRTIIIWILVGVIFLSSLGVFLYKKISEAQKGKDEVPVLDKLFCSIMPSDAADIEKYVTKRRDFEKDEVIEIEFMEFLVPKKSNKTERLYYIATRYGYYEGNGVYYIGFYSSFRVLGVVDLTEEGKTIFTIKDYFVTLKITVNVITPYSGEIWFDGAIGKTQYLEGEDISAFIYDKPEGFSLPEIMCFTKSGQPKYLENCILTIPREKMHNYMSDFSKFDGEKFVGCSFDLENQAPGIYKVRVTVSLNECTSDDLFIIEEDPFYSEVSYGNFDEYILLVIE